MEWQEREGEEVFLVHDQEVDGSLFFLLSCCIVWSFSFSLAWFQRFPLFRGGGGGRPPINSRRKGVRKGNGTEIPRKHTTISPVLS